MLACVDDDIRDVVHINGEWRTAALMMMMMMMMVLVRRGGV
jgi:hypothetical protein